MKNINEYLLGKNKSSSVKSFPLDRRDLKDFIKKAGFNIIVDYSDTCYGEMLANLDKLANEGPAAVISNNWVRLLKQSGISRDNPVYMIGTQTAHDEWSVSKEYDIQGYGGDYNLSYRSMIDELNKHFDNL